MAGSDVDKPKRLKIGAFQFAASENIETGEPGFSRRGRMEYARAFTAIHQTRK
jgi:hypothetical protein